MIVGGLLERCARRMRGVSGRLTPAAYSSATAVHGDRALRSAAGAAWDDDRYRGDAYGSYGWACNVVELESTADTFEVSDTRT